MRIAVSVLATLLFLSLQPACNAEDTPPSQGKLTSQQEKMKTCNADAREQALTGDARKEFMSTCLSGKKLTPQQEKMSRCSKDAKAKGLKGDARTTFMSTCLKG